MEIPKGVRLNNLGNVRATKGIPFEGEVIPSSDSAFKQFRTIEDGLRCVAKILLTYYNKHELKCVAAIIPRWAPTSENDVKAYMTAVCLMLGVKSAEVLDLMNPATLTLLVKAIARQETGFKSIAKELWADDYTIMRAVTRAYESEKDVRIEEEKIAGEAEKNVGASGDSSPVT